MKKNIYAVFSIVLLFLGSSCKKDESNLKGTASIYVINAAIGEGAIKIYPNTGPGFVYSKAPDLGYATSGRFAAFTGSTNVTVVSSADTTKTLFSRTIDLKPTSSLYIAGQSPNIDTIYRVENNFPLILRDISAKPDSSIYVRFVNLSPGSPPIDISLTNSVTKESAALPYKGITDFKKYTAVAGTADYSFEFKNSLTGEVLASYPVYPNDFRFKTMALVFTGIVGSGTDAPNVFWVFYN